MTREEQITFKAGSIADGCIAHGAPWKDYYKGFIEGAKWADANPSKPSLPFHIDEAAKEYSTHVSDGHHYRDLQCGFKAGAEWMAGQGVSEEFDVEDGMLPCFDSRLLGLNTIACAPTVLQCKDDDVVIMQLRKK